MKIFKCTVGDFSIVDGFEVADILFANEDYMAVSCVEE
jgi:hypothetical protein